MTPAERIELIDRASRVARLTGEEYTIARADLEEHLISRVPICDLIAIRDGALRTIGVHLISDVMVSWNFE